MRLVRQVASVAKVLRAHALRALAAVSVCALLCSCAWPGRQQRPGRLQDVARTFADAACASIRERLDSLPMLEGSSLEESPGPQSERDAADPGDGSGHTGAVEPPTIEPLQEQLEAYAAQTGMQVCVSVIDLTDGAIASCHDDSALPSASMIKLLIAYAFLEQVHEGARSLDATYTLQYADLVGGSGTLIGRGAGASVTYREALMRMIDVSDNVGANVLIDAIGMDAINATAAELGLDETQLNRRMMDEAAIAAGIDNYTSARDLAHLLQLVYEGSFVDEAASDLMRQALEQQEDWGGIRSGLPEGTVFAHKTGALATVLHDGGIVEGEHPYVLVVLCGGEGFYPGGAQQAMADIARMTNDALEER